MNGAFVQNVKTSEKKADKGSVYDKSRGRSGTYSILISGKRMGRSSKI